MAGEKPRPSWDDTKRELKKLQDQISAVLAAGEDKDGKLTSEHRKMAERALSEIEGIRMLIGPCPQGLSPYRK